MKYEVYEKKVLKVLSELRDGATDDDVASITIRALENIFNNGQNKVHNDRIVLASAVSEEEDDGPIDPKCLAQEYADLDDEDFNMHAVAIRDAAEMRLKDGE